MATYKGILTNNGKALIASATVNNKINYSHIAVGDGNGSVPDPSETRTALVNEKARIALNVVEINPNNTNQIMCEAIIPSNIGGFYIRELGLFAGPTMVVNANYPPTLKPLPDDGGAREINIKMVINIQNAEVIALYLDDSLIYATREWVNTNYIRRNEIVDNLTTNDSNKPLSAKQGKVLQDNKLEKTANAVSASKWATARTVQFSGAATGSFSIDGSANSSCLLTLSNSGVIAGSYASTIQIPQISVNEKGQITAVSQQNIRSASITQNGVVQLVDDLTTDDAAKALTAKQGKYLQDYKLNRAVRIPDNADLNGYQSQGSYFVDLDLSAQTIKNSPSKLSFTLQVDVTAGVIQRLTTYNGAGTQQFIRSYYIEWSGWQRIYSELSPQPTSDAIDHLNSSDAKKPLSANQGRLLNVTKLDKATAQSALTTDKEFLDKYASSNTPSFFFDSGSGKFFSQFTAGVSSSLNLGSYFVVGASPLDNKVKAMTGVKRENGTYDLQKNLTLLDSESNNIVNGDFIWDQHKSGGWARGLAFKAKAESNIYSGFGAFGNTDTVEKIYIGFGGNNLWSEGNGKGIWIDQNKAFSNCNWEFSGTVSGSFLGNFYGSIQAKDNRNVSPVQIQGGTMGYYFAEYSGLRYGTASSATYGDFLALNSYNDASGGNVNGLFFDKTSHQMYHFQNTYGTNNWGTPRQIAYTDNQIFTGTNKFNGDVQITGGISVQKLKGEGDFKLLSNNEGEAKRLLTGGLLASDSYADADKIPALGIYSKGTIKTAGAFSTTSTEAIFNHEISGRYLFINANGWGCYSPQGAVALDISYGGTGSTSLAGAKTNLQLNRFAQDPSVTSMYAPTTNSRIVITDNSWGIWSVNPEFNQALSAAHGGTGNTQGIAPSASKLQTPRRINNVNFDGTGDINISAPLRFLGTVNESTINTAVDDGYYLVASSGIAGLYSYGVLEVRVSGLTINQSYSAHQKNNNGSVAVRQSWGGANDFTPWRVLDKPSLGVDQNWQNVTASRAINTTYYNGTGSPIMINVGFDDTDTINPTITIVVNGVVIIDQKYDGGTNFGTGQYCFVVPNASYYSVNNTTVNSHKIWSELR